MSPIFRKKKAGRESEVDQGAGGGSAAAAAESGGIMKGLRSGLKKTHDRIAGGLQSVLAMGRKLDDTIIEEVEEQLYQADIGPRTVVRLCERLTDAYRKGSVRNTDDVIPFLQEQIKEDLTGWDTELNLPGSGPAVILVVGVNGSGKTTTIGKLAHRFRMEGKDVLLAACDTFRAAAGEQLNIWSEWSGADIVRNESADPAAVAFDAMDRAISREYDVLIVDTAGRVHTRKNLMSELEKIRRIIARKLPGAPHEILLVLDANTGQNGISQAQKFHECIGLTGIVLAKLDGTAKGGIVFGMRDQIDIPVKFVGLGQEPEDLTGFDAEKFVEALFE